MLLKPTNITILLVYFIAASCWWQFDETAAFQPIIIPALSSKILQANHVQNPNIPYSFDEWTILKSSSDDKNNEKNKKKKRGYQFGDITKSIINKITDKDEYEFGDLSRHVDAQVKSRIANLNEKNSYEFGDLSRYLVKDLTNSTEYKFGDITKAIVKKVKSNSYNMEDLALLVKALVSFGVGLTPVASFLPVKLLIELLNYSIAGDLGTKVVSSITLEIDKRMKEAIVGDENYKVGDLTSNAVKKAVLKYTGRDEYKFGDITKATVENLDKYDEQQKEIALLNQKLKEAKEGVQSRAVVNNDDTIKRPSAFLSDQEDYSAIAKELELWDERYLKDLNEKEKKEKIE